MTLQNEKTRQQAIFFSIIQNFKEASGAMEAMASSAGTLDSSYAKYLDSATAHLNRFKAQFQDLSQNVVQSYLIGDIADVGTGILWVVNQIAQLVDKLGGLKTAILAVITTVSALRALDTARSLEMTRLKMQEMTAAIFDRRIAVDSLTSSIQAMNAQEKESLRTMIIKEAAARGVSDAERDQILSVAGLTASERILETQSKKVAVGFKGIWSSMSLLGKISTVLSIASVVSSLLGLDEKVRDLFKTTEERIGETSNRLKELQDQANTTVNNFQRIRKSTEEIIPNFVKLAEGVDEFGRQGTLTNEEYAEFISLNNQLAELFPEINMGMDSNGNAMLMLDYKAQDLEQSIRDLIEAQRDLANQSLIESIDEQYGAVADQIDNYNDKIEELAEIRDKLLYIQNSGGNGAATLIQILGPDIMNSLTSKYRKELESGDSIIDWDRLFASDEYQTAIKRYDHQIEQFRDKIKNSFTALMPSLTAFMQEDYIYTEKLNDIGRRIADEMLKGADLSGYSSAEEIKSFIVNGILRPIDEAAPEVKDAFASLLDLNSALEKGEIEYGDYVNRVRSIFTELFDSLKDGSKDGSEAENNLIEWLKLLGIYGDSDADIIENLIIKFGGLPSVVEESNEELKKFTDLVGDLKSSYDLLAKAQTDMDNPEGNGGLTTDTLKALADAEEDYLKYLYEENGVIKLNTQAYKQYIEQKQRDHLNTLRQQRDSVASEMGEIRSSEFNDAPVNWKQENRQKYAELKETLKDLDLEISVTEYALDKLGETTDNTADKFGSLQKAIKDVSDNSSGLETLSKMYEDIENGGDFDFSALVSDDFVTKFGDYSQAYEDFMAAVAESPTDIEACRAAFENLATEYVYGSGMLDELNEGNQKVVAAMLEHMGVANADAVVQAELARQKERVSFATSEVANSTVGEVNNMLREQKISLATAQVFAEVAAKKMAANLTTIKTSADIQNLMDLATAANATAASLDRLAKVKQLQAEMDKVMSRTDMTAFVKAVLMVAYKAQIQNLLNQGIQFTPVAFSGGNSSYSGSTGGSGGSGGSSGSSGSSSSSSQKAETWFEKEYKRHNHLRKMEKETDKTYFAWLDGAYKKAYSQGIISLDDYRKYQEEVFDGLRSLFKDHLTDAEHQIYLLDGRDAQSRDINKIISVYKGLMKDVRNESSKARSYGLNESSEYIQELQKQYREYAKALEEARSNWFKELNDDWKFRIDDLTQHGADPNTIVKEYRAVAEKVQKEIQWYLSNGFTISDDVVQDLVRQLWEITDDIVSVANSAVDGIQNVYSTLTDAAKEWAQTGYLSVDSLQSILELGPKYLSFLYDENGQLKINEAAIQKVLAARTEELAVDNAMVYAKQLLAAAEHKDKEELKALTKVESSKTASTWDMVYATIALAEATGKANGIAASYFDNARDYVDKMRSLTNTTITTIAASYETLNSDYISQADALEAVIGYTKELIKFETTQHIDALKDEIEAYKKIVDAKKESLKLSKEQDEHDKDLAEKIEEIAQLQAKIDQLALDDSREAIAQRAKLEEQLAEKQKALADSQNDYAYDKQVEALDKSYEAFESEKNAEIDTLENMYQSEEALYNAAIDRIANGWDDLYSQLIDWNTKYGSVLNDTITAAWEQAAAAVQRYGDILKAIEGVNSHEYIGPNSASIVNNMKQNALAAVTAVGDEQGRLLENNRLLAEQYSAAYGHKVSYKNGTWVDSDTGKALYTISKDEQVQAIVNAMRKNGSLYGKSDKATRKYLSELNLILGERLGKLLGQHVYRKSGVWYIGNKKLFDVYHSGGIVGGNASKKQTEVLALLEKGEAVLDKKREAALYKVVDFVEYLSDKLGSAVNLSKLSLAPRRTGISSTSISDGISGIPISVGDAAVNTTVSVQINHSGPFRPEDADNFGRIIADSTIDKINSTFTKRGISSIGRAALKK